MLNYANLNDVEFEYLCQDIMQRKLNTELHRFASGKDGGIDLADDVHSKNIIVQIKHYIKSPVSKLMVALRNELDKVVKLSPKEYYVCCSKELSPQKVEEIYNLFSNYMRSTSNVITLNDIDDFLNAPENIEILKKHYKLWIESTGILQEIGNTNVFVDCETLLADIENEKNLFVKTSAFDSALKCLQDNKQLNNPKEIWKDEYERRLEKVDRLLLLTLYSLSDSAVDESKVKICFEHRISCESGIDTTINQYEASLSRLLEGFVQIISENGTKKLAMVNPSVNDYIDGRMNASTLEKQQLINCVCSIQQKKRLLSESDFDMFAQAALKNHEIEKYLFDSEDQKKSFITFYISKYKIYDDAYSAYIQSFLKAPYYLCIYGKETITSIEIFKELFQNDSICEFYRIGDFLKSKSSLEKMLDNFAFDEKVEVIHLIDHFYSGDNRASFVETASKQLRCAIERLCEDLNADEFEPDINRAIELSKYFDGDYADINVEKATCYIEDDIVSDIEDIIDSKLSTLPDDIKHHQNYTDNLIYSIYGVEELLNSYFEDDGYDYDYHENFYDGYEDSNSEVDYIFNRN